MYLLIALMVAKNGNINFEVYANDAITLEGNIFAKIMFMALDTSKK